MRIKNFFFYLLIYTLIDDLFILMKASLTYKFVLNDFFSSPIKQLFYLFIKVGIIHQGKSYFSIKIKVEIQEYLDKMKEIQDLFFDYMDEDANDQEKFNKLINDKQQLKSLIILLASIADHHYCTFYFFEKTFKDKINKNINFDY